MKKLVLLIALIYGCKSPLMLSVPPLEGVKSIEITIISENKRYVFTEKEIIRTVLLDYIGTAEKKLWKSIPTYEVIIVSESKYEKFYINGCHVLRDGVSYEMEKDFSEFVSQIRH